ncbi:hypothetical protein ACFTWF_26165 [Rhodococcus sp. NPDC056960]|uniref:hypothetical protein n=1 Tax=Rhodococcus sp. NPDC056960 TaxID=3345982 RepID=UPI0036259125
MQHTIVEKGRARAPAGVGTAGKVLVGGHLALGGATVVIMAFSLSFVCTLDNGTQPWTWPSRYSTAWFVAAAIVVTTLWALFVTGVVIFASGPSRALGTATLVVATALGAAAVIGLFGPSENSALQLWLVCAMNLGYQAVHLRSG